MRVSIVITNHNCEGFVAASIESALAQTHVDTQVVVVDDGSTDRSAAVLERYRDRVRVLYRPWGGQGAAVNAGFAVSTGDVVIFLDPDDILFPAAASRAAELIAEGGVAKAQWPLLEGDERGIPTGEVHPKQALDEGDLRDRLWSCPHYTSPPQSGNAYARWYLDRVLPMPESEFPAGADCYLYQLVIPFGEVRTCAEPLSIYRRHDASVSAQPLAPRARRWARLDDAAWQRLAEECERAELPRDLALWRSHSWNHRLAGLFDMLDTHVDAEARILVVDDNGSTGLYDDTTRAAVQWWGMPPDDAGACAELERYRQQGIRYVVIAWPAFWWLAYFRALRRTLAGCKVLVADPNVRIYDLATPATPIRKRDSSAGPQIPVVMCTYRRPERLEKTLEALLEQERCRVQLHVWNNNPAIVDAVDSALARAPELDPHVHHSAENVGGFGRFYAARALAGRFAQVVFIDDDVDFAPDAIATLARELQPRTIASFHAFALRSEDDYFSRTPVRPGESADYCGTGGMACDTSIFAYESLFSCPKRFWFIEDLWLSYVASHLMGWRLFGSAAAFHLDTDVHDLWVGLGDLKSEFLRYLVDEGWEISGRRQMTSSVDGPSRSRRVSVSSSG